MQTEKSSVEIARLLIRGFQTRVLSPKPEVGEVSMAAFIALCCVHSSGSIAVNRLVSVGGVMRMSADKVCCRRTTQRPDSVQTELN